MVNKETARPFRGDVSPFAQDFFGTGDDSTLRYRQWMQVAERALDLDSRNYLGTDAAELGELFHEEILPEHPACAQELEGMLRKVAENSIQTWHPHTAAHLHMPVLLPALAGEALLSALNQSMDTFDQAPAGTVLEQKVLAWLGAQAGLPHGSGGTFTAGGTQSNYMGLLLARDHYFETRKGWPVRDRGLPPDASRLRILCSEVAHFSVEKSAIQLGLGRQAVERVGCDGRFQMCPERLRERIQALRAQNLEPACIVATAGTTDFGSVDPLPEIAKIASEEGIWLHVDAAYGGALLLSSRHAHRLKGLSHADSVTIDFHKAFFQPISCSAFLLADERNFNYIRVHADYLNSESRELDGIPDLVTRSLLTTRRCDVLKLWFSFQAIGRVRFAAMIDRLGDLAQAAAVYIRESETMELVTDPQFSSVVFRFRPDRPDAESLNERIPGLIFEKGKGVVGHTVVHGKACLKLTLCNPATTVPQLTELLATIVNTGEELAAHALATCGSH